MTKIICVPKNKEAEYALDYDDALPNQLVELSLTNENFYNLWNDGVFSLINKISGSIIDEFEDEHITDLNIISNILDELKEKYIDQKDIIKMFELAVSYKTSIHFYF